MAKYCPECGVKIDGKQKYCTNCGLKLPNTYLITKGKPKSAELNPRSKKKLKKYLLFSIPVLAIIIFCIFLILADFDAPSVSITSVSNGETVSARETIIRGSATDNDKIEKIEISINDGAWEEASYSSYNNGWTYNANLFYDENVIPVKAVDKSGNTITSKKTIYVERYPVSVNWRIPDAEEYGEILTNWAHLFGNEISTNFAEIEINNDGSDDIDLVIEIDVGDYTNTCSKTITIEPGENEIYINPSFNVNLADISTTIPVEAELSIFALDTDKELFRDTEHIELLPLNYYIWENRIEGVLVLATPHADVITDILDAAAEKTPWGAIVGYQNIPGYEKNNIVLWKPSEKTQCFSVGMYRPDCLT